MFPEWLFPDQYIGCQISRPAHRDNIYPDQYIGCHLSRPVHYYGIILTVRAIYYYYVIRGTCIQDKDIVPKNQSNDDNYVEVTCLILTCLIQFLQKEEK